MLRYSPRNNRAGVSLMYLFSTKDSSVQTRTVLVRDTRGYEAMDRRLLNRK